MKRIRTMLVLLLVLATIVSVSSAEIVTSVVPTSVGVLNMLLGTITVAPATATVPLGGSLLLTATGANTAGEPLDNINPTWTTTRGSLDVTGGETTTFTAGQYEAPGDIIITASQVNGNGVTITGTATMSIQQVVSISVDQSTIAFGNVNVGSTSGSVNKIIKNEGNVPVGVTMSATELSNGNYVIPSSSIVVTPAPQPWNLNVGTDGTITTTLTLTVPENAHSGIYAGVVTYTATG